MCINTNLSSIMARNELTSHNRSIETASERLSSGSRINRAADDAAGLAISERMTSDIRGTKQGIRNAMDGIGFLQTAGGALSQITNLLQRSRELVLQGANGTNSAGNKAIIQQEIDQISIGIKDIIEGTSFNGQRSLADSSQLSGTAELEFWLKTSWVPESGQLIEDNFGLSARAQQIELEFAGDGPGGTLAYVSWTGFNAGFGGSTTLKLTIDLDDFVSSGYPSGDATSFTQDRIIAHEVVHAVMAANMDMSALPGWFTEGAAEFIHGADDRVTGDLAAAGSSGALMVSGNLKTTAGSPAGSAGYSVGFVATRMLDAASGGGIKAIMTSLAAGNTFDAAIAANTAFASQAAFETDVLANGANYIDTVMNLSDADTGSIHGSDYGGSVKSSLDVISNSAVANNPNALQLTGLSTSTSDTTIGFQLGSSKASQIIMDRIFINTDAISVSAIKVTDTEDALTQIDAAIQTVSKHQGTLGALENRLGYSINNLRRFTELTSVARSTIIDADFSKESSQLSRSQVLTQAAQAMLAQANSSSQQVLHLLQQA